MTFDPQAFSRQKHVVGCFSAPDNRFVQWRGCWRNLSFSVKHVRSYTKNGGVYFNLVNSKLANRFNSFLVLMTNALPDNQNGSGTQLQNQIKFLYFFYTQQGLHWFTLLNITKSRWITIISCPISHNRDQATHFYLQKNIGIYTQLLVIPCRAGYGFGQGNVGWQHARISSKQ